MRPSKYHNQDSLFAITDVVKMPKTIWAKPQEFPDLSSAKIISLDIESYDPDIINGPGFVRGKAYTIGIAIGTDDGFRGYYPIKHQLGGNFNPTVVFKWLTSQLNRPHQLKVGHNLMYDLEGLMMDGVTITGPFWDTMYAAALLDEHKQSYALGAIAKEYLGESKVEDSLYSWLAKAYGGQPTRKSQSGNIYRAPVSLVGPYAESDVDLPLRLYQLQKKEIEIAGLTGVMEMECGLIPLLLQLRKTGVRIDIPKAEKAHIDFKMRITKAKAIVGATDIWAAESIAKVCNSEGISYPRTATGKPSITAEWLARQKNKKMTAIADLRKLDKFVNTFLEGYILNAHINGRIHGQFHLLRSDDGGTVSGRMSSSAPNLQNLPARDEELGPLIRSLFIPENGMQWCSADYSQIEPRILLHYATGEVAESFRDTYRKHSTTDFYQLIMSTCGVSRKVSKTLSLGLMYGMGQQKLADSLNLSITNTIPLLNNYHQKLPFVKELQHLTSQAAMNRGWIKTVGGRLARFPLWESCSWDEMNGSLPLPKAEAEAKWERIRRAHTHKALNRLIQGSAADVFKMGVWQAFKKGLFNSCPLHLMVHDENNFSVPVTNEGKQAMEEIIRTMETAQQLKLPLKVEYNLAENWAAAK